MTVWDELAGQEAVVAQLRNAVAGAMTHAWLFTGPPGSGRSVAARAFAAALLCPYGGCGEWPSPPPGHPGTRARTLRGRRPAPRPPPRVRSPPAPFFLGLKEDQAPRAARGGRAVGRALAGG